MAKKKPKGIPKPQPLVIPPLPGRSVGGAPKYRVEFCAIAQRMTDAGFTNSEVALMLGISDVTFWRWKRDHPNFKAAVSMKETTAIHRVELSAFNQSVGYYVDDEEIKVVNGQIVRVPTRKFIPPDSQMTKYYLATKGNWKVEGDLPPPTEEGDQVDSETQEPIRQAARRVILTLVRADREKTGT